MRFFPLLAELVALTVLPSADGHKILVYNPKFAFSHVNYNGNMADILQDAGHTVTTLMPEIIAEYGNGTKNTEIVMVPAVAAAIEGLTEFKQFDFFTSNVHDPRAIRKVGGALAKGFTAQCEAVLDSGVIERLRDAKFDLYLVETYDPCGMMLSHLIKPRATILISSFFLWQYGEVGIPKELSYNPSASTSHLDVHSFWSRLLNVAHDALFAETTSMARRSVQALFRRRFGPDYPTIKQLTSRVSFVFTNSEPLYDFAVPTLAKVVPVPGLGAREPKPLDEYWNSVLQRGRKAVIMSFGTFNTPEAIPIAMKKSLVQMFTSFPHVTFIFKYDVLDDEEFVKVDNLVLSKWMPQNDLLNDKRVVLFITHCGMGSTQELTIRGKPGVFIPIYGDQMRNALMLERAGSGVLLDKAYLSVPDKLIGAVKEALEEDKYQRRATDLKEMIESKPFSSKELLLKYVKFAGDFPAEVMRAESHDMTWVEYHNADVWLFLVASLVSLVLLAVYLLIIIARFCCKAIGSVCCKEESAAAAGGSSAAPPSTYGRPTIAVHRHWTY